MTKFNFNSWDCKIVEKRKIWLIISAAIILVGLIVFFIFGFNVGIDFSGGSIVSVTTGDLYSESTYNDLVSTINSVLTENGVKVEITQKLNSDTAPGVQMRYQNTINGQKASEDAMFETNTKIKDSVEKAVANFVKANNPSVTEETLQKSIKVTLSNVGATASSELLWKAFLSIAVAAVLILAYVAIRFELLSGVTAVIALIHDLLVMCALMAIFRIQINSSFVAALITILGYSINNTIVLFDRVRENAKSYQLRDKSPTVIINTSIKETMTRSINTTVTTLFTIVLLAILGVTQIKEFALPIIFGLLAGTYSSIFIAPPLWAYFKDISNKNKEKKSHKYKKAEKEKA